MQARAIFEAVVAATAKTGLHRSRKSWSRWIAGRAESDLVAAIISTVRGRGHESQSGQKLEYLCGTMIELPRACLTADDIAGGRRVLLASAPTTSRRLRLASAATIRPVS